MADQKYLTLTSENFVSEVLQSDVPVLVDFWAAWCGPCRIMNPIIDELAEIFDGRAKIAKLNVDEENELALQYHVNAIPTLILFRKGERMEIIEGVVAKDLLEAKLTALLPPSSPAVAVVG
ncbi:MAG: thioredoxin [Nodosilinea sp.]|jgi:thioredoxin 1